MNRMLRVMLGGCLAAAFVIAGTEPAGGGPPEPEPGSAMEILKKSEAALRQVKLARYQAQYEGTGWVKQYVADIEGSALLGEPSKYDITRFRCEVKLTPPKSSETLELTVGCDGDLFFLIDPQAKMVYADIDQAVLGAQQRNVQRVLLQDFVAKEPLADDLKAEKVELKEATKVGDEVCYQIHVTRSETQEVNWFVSKKDWLPRRVDRVYKNPQGEQGTTRLVITNLVAESTFRAAPFKLNVPDGFTKTDEFAP